MRCLLACLLVLVLLLNVGCTDTQLTNLAKALQDTALGMGTLQTTVITANKQGLINDNDTETILRLCFKINASGQAASRVTRTLTKLNAPSSSAVLAIIAPLVSAVNDAVNTGLINITDPKVKADVYASLVVIQTALNTAQAILIATGGR